MKLLHVVPTYFPAVRYGGPIYALHGLCRALVAMDHHVHVFTTSVDGDRDSDVPIGRPVDRDGVQVHYSPSRWLRRIYYSADLSSRLALMAGDFDIVHLHSVFLFPTWAGACAAARAGTPYVVSPHGMLVRDLIEKRSTLAKRAWIHLVERRNLAGAARTHLTSGEEYRALVDLGLALSPTVTIPNGVDEPSPFLPNAVSADVKVLMTGGFDILYFGRISWEKGLDRLIGAMAKLPNVKALIAGQDENNYSSNLRSIAQQCAVSDRVQFLSRQISGADKEALFSAARIFVLPSLSESFGIVVAEAMIRGLPVVVSDRVGAAEIVEASGGGVVARSDQHGFADALTNLLQSRDRLAAMGAAGARYARERLSWREIARLFEKMYREVLAESHNNTRCGLRAAAE